MEMCEKFIRENAYGEGLEYISEKYRTAKIVVAAIKQNGNALSYISDKFKTEQLCLRAVKNYSGALAYVPYKLRTPEICLEAAKKDGTGDAIWDIPSHIKTPEFYEKITSGSAMY